jgi:hypothetical protein
MNSIPRSYSDIVRRHLEKERQMLFLSGPRQVGKTTLCRAMSPVYLNWDISRDRELILSGEEAVAAKAGADVARQDKAVLVLDEIHRFPGWKRFLKGLFDGWEDRLKIIVTGSARLDVYKRGGDSLMGRYFPHRMHPLSVGELLRPVCPEAVLSPPRELGQAEWDALWTLGGFPEPFARGEASFLARWRRLRFEQLVREDIRKETAVRELDQIEALARILSARSGEQLTWASLGKEVQASEVTARAWVAVLQSFFFGFLVKPWSRNVASAIRKTPKWYLRDWSGIADPGKRAETMLACHLLKAVHMWTDLGLGEFDLFYVRTRYGREVDFLVSKDGEPWFLAECKNADTSIAPAMKSLRKEIGVPHAFQVVFDLPYEETDVFGLDRPVAVSARTFLSQLP